VYRYAETHSDQEVADLMAKTIFHAVCFQDITFDLFVDLDAFGHDYYGNYSGARIVPSKVLVDMRHFYVYAHDVVPSVVQSHGGALAGLYDGGGEVDSPSLFNLVSMNLGLSHALLPQYGGWGDMFREHGSLENIWVTFQRDELARWFDETYSDFLARCEWEDQSYAAANHAPSAVVNDIDGTAFLYIQEDAGGTVSLSAAGSSDPDGDQLSYTWFHHERASAYDGTVSINGSGNRDATVTVPAGIGSDEIHVLLEVRDNGSPDLVSYRRIVIGPQAVDPLGQGSATATAATPAPRVLPAAAAHRAQAMPELFSLHGRRIHGASAGLPAGMVVQRQRGGSVMRCVVRGDGRG
jgi:hypothetical protein